MGKNLYFHLYLFFIDFFLLNFLRGSVGVPYENLRPDRARFEPDSGHKVIFKAKTERDKARQRHLSGCFIVDNIA